MAYLAVMFMVFMVVLAASAASVVWKVEAQRNNEQELIFDGLEFSHALAAYSARHSGAAQPFPTKLIQLVRDSGGLVVHRDLRHLYFDPMTASTDWGLVQRPDGEIIGIYSKAHGKPIQRTNFPKGLEKFSEAKDYSEWIFGPMAPQKPAATVLPAPATNASPRSRLLPSPQPQGR
jgi:hypothetical protein